jgi:uncharacterized membrane protein
MNAKNKTQPASVSWLVPAGLILISALPVIFGAVRLNQLATGAEITPDNARFFAAPAPVVVHSLSSIVYALVGAFQFVTGDRRRWLGWHRAAGWVLVVCGLLVGLSGLWMTLFYAMPGGANDLLFAFRLAFGSGMVISIGLAMAAIRRRDIKGHRAWMLRAYAIGLGAATQVLTGIGESLLVPHPDALSKALSMGAGWLINLALAEWIIRRRPAARARATVAVASPSK